MRRVQRLEPPRHPEAGEAGALARARARSRRDAAGKGRSRRQSPRRALGRRRRAGGVRRGGVGGGGGKPEPGYLSIKKRQSVPGRSLSALALELLLGKRKERRGGGKERKKERQKGMKEGESRRQDFRAGGLKSVSQSDLIQGKAMRVFI